MSEKACSRRTDVKSKTNDYISKVQDGEWERMRWWKERVSLKDGK